MSALDVVLTNLAPASDAASPWLVHRLDEQPVGQIDTPARVGPAPHPLKELLATQPLIVPTRETGFRTAHHRCSHAIASSLPGTDERGVLTSQSDVGCALACPK